MLKAPQLFCAPFIWFNKLFFLHVYSFLFPQYYPIIYATAIFLISVLAASTTRLALLLTMSHFFHDSVNNIWLRPGTVFICIRMTKSGGWGWFWQMPTVVALASDPERRKARKSSPSIVFMIFYCISRIIPLLHSTRHSKRSIFHTPIKCPSFKLNKERKNGILSKWSKREITGRHKKCKDENNCDLITNFSSVISFICNLITQLETYSILKYIK